MHAPYRACELRTAELPMHRLEVDNRLNSVCHTPFVPAVVQGAGRLRCDGPGMQSLDQVRGA